MGMGIDKKGGVRKVALVIRVSYCSLFSFVSY